MFKALGDTLGQVSAMKTLSVIHQKKRPADYDSALMTLEDIAEVFHEAGDGVLEVTALLDIIKLRVLMGENMGARSVAKEALDICQNSSNKQAFNMVMGEALLQMAS